MRHFFRLYIYICMLIPLSILCKAIELCIVWILKCKSLHQLAGWLSKLKHSALKQIIASRCGLWAFLKINFMRCIRGCFLTALEGVLMHASNCKPLSLNQAKSSSLVRLLCWLVSEGVWALFSWSGHETNWPQK